MRSCWGGGGGAAGVPSSPTTLGSISLSTNPCGKWNPDPQRRAAGAAAVPHDPAARRRSERFQMKSTEETDVGSGENIWKGNPRQNTAASRERTEEGRPTREPSAEQRAAGAAPGEDGRAAPHPSGTDASGTP